MAASYLRVFNELAELEDHVKECGTENKTACIVRYPAQGNGCGTSALDQ